MSSGWQFFIDRGGTFTDVVAVSPSGQLHLHKLLSDCPERYADATLQGIRDVLKLKPDEPIPSGEIACVRLGTTLATNALLEHRGARTVLVTTRGFADALRIGYQNRPDIFALQIQLPHVLHEWVIEADERIDAQGQVLEKLDQAALRRQLSAAFDRGIRSCAIVFMHAYKYPQHEKIAEEIARQAGFSQVSASHKVMPLMKLISRGDTTMVDAYLTPVLGDYISRLSAALPETRLFFMQSSGGLAAASHFRGRDSIVSGPAGGIIGAAKVGTACGATRILTFDMGGTSTDVAHFSGELERTSENEIAGVRIRAPMLDIHTVAAGGGSIISFDGARFRVGPRSAGANPGPACYCRGGPLTITDCNLLLGRIQADFFPRVFGASADQPLDEETVVRRFSQLAEHISATTKTPVSAEEAAYGFLRVAVDKMSSAIKEVSTQKGHDPAQYTLVCFGGAGGQHACLLAQSLGIKRILIHPLAGVLSAYGIGMADVSVIEQLAVEENLSQTAIDALEEHLARLETTALRRLAEQVAADPHLDSRNELKRTAHLRYAGTDFSLPVQLDNAAAMASDLACQHKARFGLEQSGKQIIIERISIEALGYSPPIPLERINAHTPGAATAGGEIKRRVFFAGGYQPTPLFHREALSVDRSIEGPAIIIEPTSTTVVEPGWVAAVFPDGSLLLSRQAAGARLQAGSETRLSAIAQRPGRLPSATDPQQSANPLSRFKRLSRPNEILPPASRQPTATGHQNGAIAGGAAEQVPDRRHPPLAKADPVLLELFNNLFMFIAEQMGITLQNTSHSVNIKERLDFSCALFDEHGSLIANAPHIPVHLGSMGESVRELIAKVGNRLQPGDLYALNDPYNGGTHLPDLTVVSAYFHEQRPLLYLAARGHHADIGGITPGSMPPFSKSLYEEGVLLSMVKIAEDGRLFEKEITERLEAGRYPARNPWQNLLDLRAQAAAIQRGLLEIGNVVRSYGIDLVRDYMRFVQDNAEESVRRLLVSLSDGQCEGKLDNGAVIAARITINKTERSAIIDFSCTSAQTGDNFNAPRSICKAAVLYVFRTLVDEDIPLNEGCLKPLRIIVPAGCLLNPTYPAAVVAGNVETSQVVADILYGALGKLAASQGTMNNFTFGDDRYQYYETICGGGGAGATFDGASAVHTHMTNSRITDPEVLEWRFPVLVKEFSIRRGSGGGGSHQGGDGVVRKILFRQPMTASILSNRRTTLPFGLHGGQPGQPGNNYIERCDGSVILLQASDEAQMQAGDIFVIETPGGGGFGIHGLE